MIWKYDRQRIKSKNEFCKIPVYLEQGYLYTGISYAKNQPVCGRGADPAPSWNTSVFYISPEIHSAQNPAGDQTQLFGYRSCVLHGACYSTCCYNRNREYHRYLHSDSDRWCRCSVLVLDHRCAWNRDLLW